MNYILKDKTPVPCDDEDLWNAWFTPENFEIATYNADPQIIKILFMGKPMLWPNCDDIKFFKVSVFLKAVVVQSTFHSTWEEAMVAYDRQIYNYVSTCH